MATREGADVAAGDRIELAGRRVGDVPRTGEILEVRGTPTRPHYRVRWADGHESVFFPSGGTRIRRSHRRSSAPELDVAEATRVLVEPLRDADVEFELLSHRRTSTAAGEARALGVLPQQTAKTLVARDESGARVRVVLPASCKLDRAKLAAAVGADSMTLLTEWELAQAYPQFELGAVPPFGGPEAERVVVDRRLAECDHVVLDAGVHDTSLRLATEDLLTVSDAQLADVAVD